MMILIDFPLHISTSSRTIASDLIMLAIASASDLILLEIASAGERISSTDMRSLSILIGSSHRFFIVVSP